MLEAALRGHRRAPGQGRAGDRPHRPRSAADAVNDALARQRAETVRAELIRRGVAAERVQRPAAASREPVVPTAAGVAEPRNRRVEIIVR